MKNSIMVFGAICLFATTFGQVSQIEKGTGIVSVDIPVFVELSSSKSQNGSKTNGQAVVIKPVVSGGGFVARNIMLGAGFGIVQSWSRYKVPNQTNKDRSPLYITPSLMVRYYHMFTPKVGIYGQFSAEAWLAVENNQSDKEYRIYGMLSPRMVFFPKPFVGINVGLGEIGYGFSQEENQSFQGSIRTQHHDFLMYPTVHLGTSFFIGKSS